MYLYNGLAEFSSLVFPGSFGRYYSAAGMVIYYARFLRKCRVLSFISAKCHQVSLELYKYARIYFEGV
jgi:hypothetical protein